MLNDKKYREICIFYHLYLHIQNNSVKIMLIFKHNVMWGVKYGNEQKRFKNRTSHNAI